MDEGESAQNSYPVPDAVIAGSPGVLAALVAAIVGVLVFWRKKEPAQQTGGAEQPDADHLQ